MSILSIFERHGNRKKVIDQFLYSNNDFSVWLLTTKNIMKKLEQRNLEEMGKMVLDGFLSDFEIGKMVNDVKTRFNLLNLEIGIVQNSKKEITIYIL